MTLNFIKEADYYVAEFSVDAEFSLHIERDTPGFIELLQNSVTGGKFDRVREFKVNAGDPVFDFDSGDFLGTKFIKIVSEVEPTFAAVTTSGEVTEIKSQSKEVEVTSNGTMDITPDAGFAYLNAVKVKTNVPQSGEGGGSGSASSVEYLDVTELDEEMRFNLIKSCSLVKWKDPYSGDVYIYPGIFATREAYDFYNEVMAIAIDFSSMVSVTVDSFGAIKEMISNDTGYPLEVFDSIPRITESEFYNLNA